MFARSQNVSFSKSQKASKASSFSKDAGISKHRRHESRHESRRRPPTVASASALTAFAEQTPSPVPTLAPAIVTLIVGRDQRIFAAHEDILCVSPYFQQVLHGQVFYEQHQQPRSPGSASRRIALPEDEPEIFSSVLEYLYKGDYYPRLLHDKRHNSWQLEQPESAGSPGIDPQLLMQQDDAATTTSEATVYHHAVDGDLLKDTMVYCTADKYGLDELKRIALRKQGLQSGIPCSTILSSARYAYAHTPDSDSKLRAHYLALIIRSRSTFKRSGTMQLEMFNGGSQLFFDLFVALCNHVDDISSTQSTPRSNRHF